MLYFSQKELRWKRFLIWALSVLLGKLGLCDLRVQRLALGVVYFLLLGSQSGAQVFNKATGRLNKRKELVGKKERKSLGGPFALTTLGPAQQHGLGPSLP